MRKPHRIIGKLIAVFGLATSLAACQPGDLFPVQRTPLMNELTSNMKTVCLGRYLVDVPQRANFTMGFAESDVIAIDSVEPAANNETEFRDKLSVREKELSNLKHNTEESRLREVADLPMQRGKIFVYRENAVSHRMAVVEAFVLNLPGEWLLRYKTSNKNVAEVKQEVEEISQHIRIRSMREIPTESGACINGALLDRVPTYGEEFAGGAEIEDLSWSLSIHSETSKPYEASQRVIKRNLDAIELAGAADAVKVLRKREVTLDGRKGEEFIAIYPGDGVESLSAKLELYGDGTYKVPTLKLTMEANRLAPPDPNDKRVFLSNDEALAVWDAVLKSIRPRPGAF